MSNDKFHDIICKLKAGEQPQIQNPQASSNQEGLKTLNEGHSRSDFNLNKNQGHITEISTKDESWFFSIRRTHF